MHCARCWKPPNKTTREFAVSASNSLPWLTMQLHTRIIERVPRIWEFAMSTNTVASREALLLVARAKATDPVQIAALEKLVVAARECDVLEANFAERISASKARRGANPPDIPRAKRTQINSLGNDRIEVMESIRLRLADHSPERIVRTMHLGMAGVLARRDRMRASMHPDDAAIYDENTAGLARLISGLSEFLERFP